MLAPPGIRRVGYPQAPVAAAACVNSRHNENMPETSSADARYLAPAQVAELLSIDVDEVMALIQEGRLRGARLGSPARWRVEESSLRAYLDEQVEEARRMALWRQANEASFPEVWGATAG